MATTEKITQARATPSFSLPTRRRIPYWVTALLKNPVSVVGALIVVFYIAVAILAPVLAPPRVPSQPYLIPRAGFTSEPKPPSAEHPFGTTQGQYDVYYGVVWGTRTAFQV